MAASCECSMGDLITSHRIFIHLLTTTHIHSKLLFRCYYIETPRHLMMPLVLPSRLWFSRLFALCWCALNVSEGWIPTATIRTTKAATAFGSSPFTRSRSPLLPPSESSSRSTTSSTRLFVALPEGYQEFGEHLIRKAGSEVGISKEEDLTIEWKAGRIIVTVHGKVYVSAVDDGEEEVKEEDDEMSSDLVDSEEEEEVENESVATDEESAAATATTGLDVTALARAINAALDDDGIGFAIAEAHEIEVTTPGASEEIRGAVMFEAYKGFEVICQQRDLKTNKTTKVEGRLVERDDEFTTINIKGRMKKLKNSTVLSMKLPKAKREKGK